MQRENRRFPVGIAATLPQGKRTSFLPGGVCNKADPPLSFQGGPPPFKGSTVVLGEYEIILICRMIGVVGVAVYVGTCALLYWRVFDGGSVAFFAGNTAAAALVLASNMAGFHIAWLMAQIVLIAIAMTAMIALFFEPQDS